MTQPNRSASGRVRVMLIGPGPTTRGGIAQFNRHLAEALAEAQVETTLLPLSPVYPSWTKPGRQAPISSEPLPPRVHLATTRLVAWRPWTLPGAIRELRRRRPAVVIFQWWHPMFAPSYAAVAAAAHRFGARVAFVCHNAEPHERFVFARSLTSLAIRQADSVLVLSEAVGETISRYDPHVHVVKLRHPPYTNFFSAADPTASEEWRGRIAANGRPVVLFFGNVRPYKGLADLITSFREVRAEVPALLVVAGTFFESIDDYRRQVATLDLEEDVRLFPDYVPDSAVAPLLSLADLVVLPYRSGSQTGIAPLAAALGKPVVATDVGGIAEGPRTRVVPPRDTGALATAIVESLRLPAPPRMSTATWSDWADAVLELAGAGHSPLQDDDSV